MNLEMLRASDTIIFEAIVGSKLYGLDTAASDTDIKGVFSVMMDELKGLYFDKQVSDETNDTTFYEISRFLSLAMASNPNTLELLYIPESFIIQKSEVYDLLLDNRDLFLTKAIKNSLGGYAKAQIFKARGKNKKIVNPMPKERKTPLDYCYVLTYLGAKPLNEWLDTQRGRECYQESYGLSKLNHTHNLYYMYYNSDDYKFKGISKDGANELRLSSIPKDVLGEQDILYFNSESYSNHCKKYKEYWDWIEARNESRYISVEKHGKGYDGKNLMHCFRLLEMGIDAAKTGELIVKRPNRKFLLDIREGEYEYDYLIKAAEDKMQEMDEAIETCSLPDKIDITKVNNLLINIRNAKLL